VRTLRGLALVGLGRWVQAAEVVVLARNLEILLLCVLFDGV